MIPKLFAATATTFTTQGIGALTDSILCYVDEERNGEYEGYLKYPITGVHYADIALRSIIVAKPNFTDDPQPFRVYDITKPLNGVVTVRFRHISYDLSGYPVEPFTASTLSGALSGLVSNCPVDCSFTLTSSRSVSATFKANIPASIRSWMGGKKGSLLDVYGGEWKYDGFTASLPSSRGQNRGVTIRYGKNLTALEQEENNAAVYTGVYPYWTDAYGENLVQITGRIVHNTDTPTYSGATYDYERILPVDFSNKWEEAPSEGELRSAAIAYIEDNEIGTPKVNLRVEFAQVSKLVRDQVDLCDTVTVQFEKLGVTATAKCIKTRWNVLLDRYEAITLGDAKTNLAETIVNTKKTAETAVSPSSLEAAVDQATAQITGANGGYYRELDTNGDGKPDETVWMKDADDIATALKLWRFNYAGLGHSNNGYNGTYGIALTADGAINASMITVGVLNADIAKAGSLQSVNFVEGGEGFSLNLETGETYIKALSDYGWNPQEGVLQTFDGENILTYAGETIRAYSPATYTQIQNNANEINLLTGTASGLQSQIDLIPGQITAEVSALQGQIEAELVLEIATDSGGNPYGKISANADYIQFDTGDLVINSSGFTLDAAGNATFAGAVTASSLTLGSNTTPGAFRLLSPDGFTDVNLSGDTDGSYISVTDTTSFARSTLRGKAGSLILSLSSDSGATYTEIGSVWVNAGTGRSVANIDTIQVGRYQAAPAGDLRNNQLIASWDYTNNLSTVTANKLRIRKEDGSSAYELGNAYWGSNGEVIHYTATGGNILRAYQYQVGTEADHKTAIQYSSSNIRINANSIFGSNGEVIHYISSNSNNVLRAYQYQIGTEADHKIALHYAQSKTTLYSDFAYSSIYYLDDDNNPVYTLANFSSSGKAWVHADVFYQDGQSLANVLIAD